VGFFRSKRKIAQELMTSGSKAVGTVVTVQDTGMTINNNPRVKLTFRIEPLDGSSAFEAEKTATVPRISIPRQGERYPVWYEQQDPSTWSFSIIGDDSGRATLREQFGEVADTFTGMGTAGPPSA
jgi:hypothetical protein